MKRNLAAAMTVLFLAGCASIKVIKVKPDEAVEGIPFYLPRPYVTVFEPFVVASKAYLVGGQLSPDGQYLLIDNVKTDLDGHFQVVHGERMAVPSRLVRRAELSGKLSRKQPKLGGPQGKVDEIAPDPTAAETSATPLPSTPVSEGKSRDDKTKPPGEATSKDKDTTNSPGEPTTSVGQFNISVLNSNASFAVTPGRRFFDITWLPDFDEKYVVQGNPGLGNSNIAVTLGQGWSLQGLDAKLDNSAIVKPILDFYKVSMDAYGQLAKGKILPADAISTGGPQGSIQSDRAMAGIRLSVKVTVVQVAAPGIYPILKPSEKAAAEETRKSLGQNARNLLLPWQPFTNVAYNTYEVIVVEAARPSGDSPMNLQRYFDPVTMPALPEATVSAINPSDSPPKITPEILAQNLNEALAERKGDDGGFWRVSNVKSMDTSGKKWSMTATLSGGRSPPTDLPNAGPLQVFIAPFTQNDSLPADITVKVEK